jgi:hypothetical protein
MMTPDILRKLTAELAQPITSERQVVYILCQVRKIVDRDPNRQRWNSLKLYCDWAMHTDLTFDSRTRPFIQQIEDFFLATLSPDGAGVSQAQHEAIQKLVYLDGFREDLHTFFVEQGLPHDLADDGEKWNGFLRHSGGVIHDGSLVYGKGLQLIKRMTFTTLPSSSEAMPFNIKWEILFNDGRGVSLMLHPNWKLLGSRLNVTYAARDGEPETPPAP